MIKFLSIADLVTLINAIFGFLAIIMLFLGEFRISFSLILLALLADGLDGIVARKFGVGKIGDYLESMADMTSMSIAPMAFIFSKYYEQLSDVLLYLLFLTVLIIFLICSIIRLSSFHILKDKNYFVGLPASASTILIIILAFLEAESFYVLVFILLMSFAMISPIRFPKLGFRISTIAAILIFLTIMFGKNYGGIAPILLFTVLAIYVIFGPFCLRKSVS